MHLDVQDFEISTTAVP